MRKTNQSAANQRQRLLDYLQKHGRCSTFQARHLLDIIAVAARIFELRHIDRHNIVTQWVTEINPGGKKHRVANYVLLSGKYEENQ